MENRKDEEEMQFPEKHLFLWENIPRTLTYNFQMHAQYHVLKWKYSLNVVLYYIVNNNSIHIIHNIKIQLTVFICCRWDCTKHQYSNVTSYENIIIVIGKFLNSDFNYVLTRGDYHSSLSLKFWHSYHHASFNSFQLIRLKYQTMKSSKAESFI